MKATARRVGRDAGSGIARRRRTRLAAVVTAMAAAALAALGAPAVASATPGSPSISAAQAGSLTMTFSGSSAGATSLTWDFGDQSAMVTDPSPSHTYVAAGTYTVTLTASDGVAPDATATQSIHVYAAPTAGFAAGQVPNTLNVAFTDTSAGEPTSFSWDFDDGSTSSKESPTHAFPAAGTYNVTLTVSNPAGSSTTGPRPVTVNPQLPPPPHAQFTSAAGAPGHTMSFADTSTNAPTSWQWNFGDASSRLVQSFDPNPVHTYARPGSYTVTHTACNAGGCNAIKQSVTPPNQPPTAAFTVASNPASAGMTVGFDASSSTDPDLDRLSYRWDLDNDGQFDDGSAVTAAKLFPSAGTFTVRLRVSDGAKTASLAVPVTVLNDAPPVPSFTFAPANPGIGTLVTFRSTSTDPDGSIAKLEWDLNGDGVFDVAAPTAQYSYGPGPHIVSLRATDNRGVSAVAFQTVNVPAPPAAPAPKPPAPTLTPAPPPALLLLSPFPVVRIRGSLVGAKIHIDLLSVRAPLGAIIKVRCRGKGCRSHLLRARGRAASKPVRFRRMRGNVRPGTVIEVFVIGRDRIGKYTRFKIRAGKAPGRRDLCLPPGSMKAEACPSL